MPRPTSSRPSVLWLQLLLAGALACVLIILAEAYRAARSSRDVAEHALRDYADFAAWSYREHLSTRLREAADALLGPVNHGEGLHTDPTIPPAAALGHYISWNTACLCHRPRAAPLPSRFFAFTLGSDTLGVAVNYAAPAVGGWLGDPPASADGSPTRAVPVVLAPPRDEARRLNRLITFVSRRPRPEWGYSIVVDRYDAAPRVLAIRTMPTTWGDTVVYAVEWPEAAIDSVLGAVLATDDLLPASLVAGRSAREMLDLQVADAAGAPLYSTPGIRRWELDAETALPESYGGFRVRAQLRPQLASALLIGGVPRSRVPLLLLMLGVTAGLSVLAAVQLRREIRFASERANFVANVSHELRTPLTQVRLVLDTLRLGRGGDAASRDEALGMADREVLRLQHLVEGVLRFTRGPRRHDGPVVNTDAAADARTVIAEFAPLAAAKSVDVRIAGDQRVPVSLHSGTLRQVLLNLLDNAVKYGGEGATVTVEVRRRRGGGGALLAVSDQGPGVPVQERDRIWRPFERGGIARERAAGGSGIGLTIVRAIAGQYGGRAWVEDAPGGGARFLVDLPDAAG
jgi:signal transduction histidine kinase